MDGDGMQAAIVGSLVSPHSLDTRHASLCRFLRQSRDCASHTFPPVHFAEVHQVVSTPGESQAHSTHLWLLGSLLVVPRWQMRPGSQSASVSQPSTQESVTQREPWKVA